jgi:hypothetical protein
MRNRLQSMYRVEQTADSRLDDLLKPLDQASSGRQENCRSK